MSDHKYCLHQRVMLNTEGLSNTPCTINGRTYDNARLLYYVEFDGPVWIDNFCTKTLTVFQEELEEISDA